jgi:hypothetical protein
VRREKAALSSLCKAHPAKSLLPEATPLLEKWRREHPHDTPPSPRQPVTNFRALLRNGKFMVKRKTQAKQLVRKLKAIREDMLDRMHTP